ncbi:HlyD family efflux transporter periplasmic adaptor subunit [Bernardetia litoralis]|nr:HlyD family efflux transporter periplasmic adaptor subunit [Bernardetia litoralis]
MKNTTEIETIFHSYSEETQELLTSPQGFFMRSGITIISSVLLLMFLVSYFIRYPELSTSEVTIYANQAKASLFPKINSRIVLINTTHNQNVKENELLLVLESTTNWKEAQKLEQYLDTLSSQNSSFEEVDFFEKNEIPIFTNLGNLQLDYEQLKNNILDFQLFLNTNSHAQKQSAIRSEIEIQNSLSIILQEKYDLQKRDYELNKQKYITDSLLYKSDAIAKQEFLQTKSAFLNKESSFLQNKEANLNAQMRVSQLNQQLVEVSIAYQEQAFKYKQQLRTSFATLKKMLEDWKTTYLIISPIEGKISFFNPLNLYQSVSIDKEIISIIPQKNAIYAYTKVDSKYISKLKVEENPNKAKIKLEAYPFARYGWINAEIQQISLAPQENKYSVQLKLNNGLQTSRNVIVDLNSKSEIYGTVEIVLEERSLLDKFLEQTVYSIEAFE